MADKKTLSPEEKKLAAEKHVDELVQKRWWRLKRCAN